MKRLVKVVVAIALASLVAGCSVVNQAGAAAVYGSKRLMTADVAAEAAEIQAAIGAQQTELTFADINREIINGFLTQQVIQDALDEAGVTVDLALVEAQHAALVTQYGSEEALAAAAAQSAIAPSQIDRALWTSMAYKVLIEHFTDATATDQGAATQKAEQATGELLAKVSSSVEISVAPRFGAWDETNMFVTGDIVSDVIITTEQLAAVEQ